MSAAENRVCGEGKDSNQRHSECALNSYDTHRALEKACDFLSLLIRQLLLEVRFFFFFTPGAGVGGRRGLVMVDSLCI